MLSGLGVVLLELHVLTHLVGDLLEAIRELEVLDEVPVLLRCRMQSSLRSSVSVGQLDPLLRNGLLGGWVPLHEAGELEVWAPGEHVLHVLHLDFEVFDKARPRRHGRMRPMRILFDLGNPEWRLKKLSSVVHDV